MDEDELNIDIDKLAEKADLGRKWRTYRQRRRGGAPALCGGAAASLILTIAMINESVDGILPWLAFGVPLGVAIGLGYNYFSEISGNYGRIWVTVYDNGLVIDSEKKRPVATTEFAVVKSDSPHANDTIHYLFLLWKDAKGDHVSTPLHGFGAASSLLKALQHQQYSTPPVKERVIAGVAVAAVAVIAIVWALQPTSVSQLEDRDDLTAFCEDSSMTVTDADSYSGDGPHNIVEAHSYDSGRFSQMLGFSDEAQERGWNTSLSDAMLIACGEATVRSQTLQECSDYFEIGGSGETRSFDVRAADITYEIYEAATRDLVATVTVEGGDDPDWECPDQTTTNTSEFRVPPTVEDVVEALAEFVEN